MTGQPDIDHRPEPTTGRGDGEPTADPVSFDATFMADPNAGFAALRRAAPVHRAALPDGSGAWLVTRYTDVRAGLADPRLSLDKANGNGSWKGFSLPPALDANLINMDPPDHTRVRRLVTKAFTGRQVARLRPKIIALANDLLDRVEPAGRADLIADYAGPLPVEVICDLLGVPPADRSPLRDWTDVMVSPPADDPGAPRRVLTALVELLVRLIADKRRQPGDDLLSAMIAVRDEGDQLTEDELTSLAFLLLFAGYENTVHAIGTGLLALLQSPEQMSALRARLDADGGLPDSAVEEFLRHEPPVTVALRRFPLEDLPIGGVTIPAGDTVLLGITTANRDPDRFPDAETLDVGRGDNAHLTLGHGIHYCLGAPLARLEISIAVGTVLRRLPRLALAVAPEELAWRPSYRIRGLNSLPVVF